ncbi:MAG: DUF3656 domain-containing protein, partial [Clostridia bacterium]|nr:DUF3656 domain-containing protein [Clostridia bacterium]
SPSDLCVGEEVHKLIAAGVSSLKIEGRMRRAEYVAAAVRYYRGILENTGNSQQNLSDLKRAYNRGNYTRGLAFGQDKRFLSPNVQGHLGEKVGVVKVEKGAYLVESAFQPQKTDAFKILRQGIEVGGATVAEIVRKGFIIRSNQRLKNGDGVFVTTDGAAKERALSGKKTRAIRIRCRFEEGGFGVAEGGGVRVQTESVLPSAANAPIEERDVVSCFMKTDGLPFEPKIESVEIVRKQFLPKSALNALRRAFFAALCKGEERKSVAFEPFSIEKRTGENHKTAIIVSSVESLQELSADIVIWKGQGLNEGALSRIKEQGRELYLYYPCLVLEKEEEAFASAMQSGLYSGVYVENYGGIAFAKRCGVRAFLGTGLNIGNAVALSNALKIPCVSYVALSKELTQKEQERLAGERVFTLACGNLKVMDLCYCPFEKTCGTCDKKQTYILTDENRREFPVRRFVREGGGCRFEIYNCADLIGSGVKGAGKLIDATFIKNPSRLVATLDDEEKQKAIFENYTQGHRFKGVY